MLALMTLTKELLVMATSYVRRPVSLVPLVALTQIEVHKMAREDSASTIKALNLAVEIYRHG